MNCESFKRRLLNILFPIDCAGCGREDFWLCPDCLDKLPFWPEESCFFCGRYSPAGKTCSNCAASHDLDGVFICADYKNKVIASLIKKLKYSFAAGLSEVLGEIAVRFFQRTATEKSPNFKRPDFSVLPIPLHRKRFNWRGFNQAEMIAAYFAARTGLEIRPGLIRVKHKTPQAGLAGYARRENIKDCFAWTGKELARTDILLLDDVATTGSTLDEAAGVLKAAGAGQVWGLVIAKG